MAMMVGAVKAPELDRESAVRVAASTIALKSAASTDDLVREIARRRRVVVYPLFLGSFLLFCATVLALAYLPGLVGTRIFGAINVAYLLALAQFGITFLVAAAYSIWARSAIDPLTAQACKKLMHLAAEQRS